MAPTLYMLHGSPPVRAVLMTAKAIGLDLDLKEVNLLGGEHLSPEYLKINPQHTVPVLKDDDGFTIADSHPIMTYLISKYAKDDSLYPKDLQKRNIVDQRLYFEAGTFFPRLLQITKPIVFKGKTTIDQVDKDNLIEAYGFLESYLEGKSWVAGDFLSIADFSLTASVGSIAILVPIDSQKFPNITAWLKKTQTLPAYEANKKGQQMFYEIFNSKLSKQ